MTAYQSFILTSILSKFIKGELDAVTNTLIRLSAEEIALDNWLIYIIEIAYHIDYSRSILSENISESTYKKMKKLVKDNLIKRLSGG